MKFSRNIRYQFYTEAMWEVENNPDILCMDKDDSAEEFLCEAYGIGKPVPAESTPVTAKETTDPVAPATDVAMAEVVDDKAEGSKEAPAEGFEFSDNDSEDMTPLYNKLIIIVGEHDTTGDSASVLDKVEKTHAPDSCSITKIEPESIVDDSNLNQIKACWVVVNKLGDKDVDKGAKEAVESESLTTVPPTKDRIVEAISIDSDDNHSAVISPIPPIMPLSLISKPLETTSKNHHVPVTKSSKTTQPLFEKILENLRNEKLAHASLKRKRQQNKEKTQKAMKIENEKKNGAVPIMDNLFNKRFTILGSGFKISKKIVTEEDSAVREVIDLVDERRPVVPILERITEMVSGDKDGHQVDNTNQERMEDSIRLELDHGGSSDGGDSVTDEIEESQNWGKSREENILPEGQGRLNPPNHNENISEEDEEAQKWGRAKDQSEGYKEIESTVPCGNVPDEDEEAQQWRDRDRDHLDRGRVRNNISGRHNEEEEEGQQWNDCNRDIRSRGRCKDNVSGRRNEEEEEGQQWKDRERDYRGRGRFKNNTSDRRNEEEDEGHQLDGVRGRGRGPRSRGGFLDHVPVNRLQDHNRGQSGRGRFKGNVSSRHNDNGIENRNVPRNTRGQRERGRFLGNVPRWVSDNIAEETEEARLWDRMRGRDRREGARGRVARSYAEWQNTNGEEEEEAQQWNIVLDKDDGDEGRGRFERSDSQYHKEGPTAKDVEMAEWRPVEKESFENSTIEDPVPRLPGKVGDVIDIVEDDEVEVVAITTARKKHPYCRRNDATYATDTAKDNVQVQENKYGMEGVMDGEDFVEGIEEEQYVYDQKEDGGVRWFEMDKYGRQRSPPRYCELVQNRVIEPPTEDNRAYKDKYHSLWADSDVPSNYSGGRGRKRRMTRFEDYEEYMHEREVRCQGRDRGRGRVGGMGSYGGGGGGSGRYMDTDRPTVSQVDKSFDVWRKYVEVKKIWTDAQRLNHFVVDEPVPPQGLPPRCPYPSEMGGYQQGPPYQGGSFYSPVDLESAEYGDYSEPRPAFRGLRHGNVRLMGSPDNMMSYRHGPQQSYGDIHYPFDASPPYRCRRPIVPETPDSPDPPSDHGNDFTAMDSPPSTATATATTDRPTKTIEGSMADQWQYSRPDTTGPDSGGIVAT